MSAIGRRQAEGRRLPEAGHGGDQRAGVGVPGLVEDLLDRALLHHPAVLHDQHPVADVVDHAQVVGDEQLAMPSSACRSASRSSTWAWIETSSAETGSSQTITSGPGASARAMATRWRWPPDSCAGGGRATLGAAGRPGPSSSSTRPRRPARPARGTRERLGDDAADGVAGVEGARAGPGRRLDRAAAAGGGAFGQPAPRPPSQADRAGVGFEQAEHEPGARGLARAGLADDAERLARAQGDRRRRRRRGGRRGRYRLDQAGRATSTARADGPAAPRLAGGDGGAVARGATGGCPGVRRRARRRAARGCRRAAASSSTCRAGPARRSRRPS